MLVFKEYNSSFLKDIIFLFIDSFNNSPWKDNWNEEITKKHLLQIINTPGFKGLLAFREEKLSALLFGIDDYTFMGKTFTIKELCVSSLLKDKGIGKKMLEEMENRLKKEGYKYINLQTLNNPSLLNFYENKGYKTDDTAVFMTKALV